MSKFLKFLTQVTVVLTALLLVAAAPVWAAPRLDPSVIIATVESFVLHQSSGLQGTVELQVNAIDLRLSLPDCTQLQAFTPDGAPLSGNTSIGVRCLDASQWTVLLPVKVWVVGDYIVAAHTIEQGQTVRQEDLVYTEGDLTQLPRETVKIAAQAIGKVADIKIASGGILQQGMLHTPEMPQHSQLIVAFQASPVN